MAIKDVLIKVGPKYVAVCLQLCEGRFKILILPPGSFQRPFFKCDDGSLCVIAALKAIFRPLSI